MAKFRNTVLFISRFILILIIFLPVFIYVFLTIKPVQHYIDEKLTEILEENLNTKIELSGVSYVPPFDFVVKDFFIKNINNNDTLVFVKTLKVRPVFYSFRKHKLVIDKVSLDGLHFEYVTDSSGYSNIDYFLANLPPSEDTGQSSSNFQLQVRSIETRNASVFYSSPQPDTIPFDMDLDTINLYQIDFRVNEFRITDTAVTMQLMKFRTYDNSGFKINNLSANIKIQDSLTEISRLNLKLNYSDLYVDDFKYISDSIVDNDYFYVVINDLTTINPADLGFFSPDFENYNLPVNLSLIAEGKLADLNIHNFSLAYGKFTRFNFNGRIIGLPNVNSTYFDLNIDNLSTCMSDLKLLRNPKTGENLVSLPENLNLPDSIQLQSQITGVIAALTSQGKILTNNGNIDFDLSYEKDSLRQKVAGIVDLNNFDVGNLLKNNKIGIVTVHDSIDFTLTNSNKIFARNYSKIFNFDFNGYTYRNIELQAQIKDKIIFAELNSKDDNFKAFLSANYKEGKSNSLAFSFRIDTANLEPLNFASDDPTSFFSVGIKGNLNWKEIEDISGNLAFSRPLVLIKNLQKLEMNNFALQIKNMYFYDSDIYKYINLESDYFDAKLQGVIDIAHLADNFSKMPAYYFHSLTDTSVIIFDDKNDLKNNFRLDVHLKDLSQVLNIFAPTVYVSNNTKITFVSQNQNHKYDFSLYSDSLKISDISVTKIFATAKATDEDLRINLTLDSLGMSDIHFNNLSIQSSTANDTLKSRIKWRNKSAKKNEGQTRINVSFERDSSFTKTNIFFPGDTIYINDYKWIIKKSDICLDSDKIEIKDWAMESKFGGKLSVYGNIGKQIQDTLNLLIQTFDISQLNPLLENITLKGFINTKFKAVAMTDSSRQLYMENVISKFGLNDISLGVIKNVLNIEGDSVLNTNLTLSRLGKRTKIINGKMLSVDTLYKSLNISGKYNLNTQKYDVVLNIINLKFLPFRKYFEDYVSVFSTTNLNGLLHISGDKILYDVDGYLNLYGAFTVKATGVRYSLNDGLHLRFLKNKIIIDKSVLTGPGLVGDMTIWGSIKHNSFKDAYLDIFLDADTIKFLDQHRTKDKSYFGTVVGTADAEIFGYPQSLTLKADVTAEKQTNLTVLLNRPGDVSNKTSILNFVNYEDTTQQINIKPENESNFNMNIDLNVSLDPEAKFRLLMDELTGEGFEVQGSGNIKIKKTTFGDFILVGRVEIEKGIYNFVLQNIINKKFKIQKGSYIVFNGDPMDATVDITTLYSVKNVDLYNLLQDNNYLGQKTQADCYIYLKGPVSKPKISFDVKLPKADRKIASQVSSLDEANMNKQFLSLLLIGRFQPLPGLVYDPNANLTMGNFNPGELISNQLNSLLSNLGTDVNLDINYQTGNEGTSDQFDVAVSVPLLNERVSVNTDIGVGGKNEMATEQNNFIGDFEVDVKLNQKGNLILKGYNKNNRNDFYEQGYTQGIGIQYKTSLDKFFTKKQKQKQKNKQPSN